jgi:hypothetical protein
MTIRGWAEFPALEFPFGAADAWRAITMHDLPASSHGKPVDVFDTAAALEIELLRVVKGEVRFDRGSRAMYAVDGQGPIWASCRSNVFQRATRFFTKLAKGSKRAIVGGRYG